jgi:hypothetical protein
LSTAPPLLNVHREPVPRTNTGDRTSSEKQKRENEKKGEREGSDFSFHEGVLSQTEFRYRPRRKFGGGYATRAVNTSTDSSRSGNRTRESTSDRI